MAPRKRRRNNQCRLASPTPSTLPEDLLLEIIARSDTITFVRCAATGKILRHRILEPSFIGRVTQEDGTIPPCILAYLHTEDQEEVVSGDLSMLHPITLTTMSFIQNFMSPIVSRYLDDLLGDYYPVTKISRGGLVLLGAGPGSSSCSILCVYDPITGHRTFLCEPPCIPKHIGCLPKYVLLTAADGIGCSFLLFVGYLDRSTGSNGDTTGSIKIQIFRSSTGAWGPVSTHGGFFFQRWCEISQHATAVILYGGIIHWLVQHGSKILTYDVRTAEPGMMVQLPATTRNFKAEQLHLGSYSLPDGHKLLRMLATDGFRLSMWHQLPSGDWALEAMIDMKEKLRMLDLDIPPDSHVLSIINWSSEGGNAVLLNITYKHFPDRGPISCTVSVVLDLETKKMSMEHLDYYSDPSSLILEIDFPSRLRAMKIFPLAS